MPKHTSDAIRRRLEGILDADRRRLRAQLCCEFLTMDAERHGLDLVFRHDAAGRMHIFAYSDFALEYAARNPNSHVGRFADSLMRLCGPKLGRLPEVTQSLSASQNSLIRADLRAMEKAMSKAQRQRLALERDRQAQIAEVIREFTDWPASEES